MNERLHNLRILLRKLEPQAAGKDGERHAERWLQDHQWIYEPVDQGRWTLSKQLRERGGKRPDFIAESKSGDDILLLDAKYHSTENGTIFRLSDRELDQYRALKEFIEIHYSDGEVWVLFMVLPKEHNGEKLVWVDLDEFDGAAVYVGWNESAKFVSLTDRDGLWYENKQRISV